MASSELTDEECLELFKLTATDVQRDILSLSDDGSQIRGIRLWQKLATQMTDYDLNKAVRIGREKRQRRYRSKA